MTPRARNAAKLVGSQLTAADGLAQLAFLVHGTLERLAAEQDLSITQTRLLGILRDRKPTMNELAKILSLDKSSITGLVDRAESRGLVERLPSARDRRVIQVRLTRVGRARVTRIEARFDAEVVDFLERLPAPDRHALSALVSRLLVAHAADHGINLFPPAENY
jgi:MarR family transcriptional regulator, lower aerobic nicotinate degradation pathway regulator